MWKVLLIVYVAVAVILAMALLYLFKSSWNELSEEEKYMEYQEGAGEGLIAICSFFVVPAHGEESNFDRSLAFGIDSVRSNAF